MGVVLESTQGQDVRLIAFSGPKGGSGVSTCVAALGRALGLAGRKVLILDFDALVPGMPHLVDYRDEQNSIGETPIHTTQTNLDLARATLPISDIDKFCLRLRQSGYDDVVLDLPKYPSEVSSDLFLQADIPILVAQPEQASIRHASQWLRHTLSRHIAASMLDSSVIQALASQPNDWEFNDIYARIAPHLKPSFLQALASFKCCFLLNEKRDNSESLQADALCHGWGMIFGCYVHFLGSISFDERRWFYERGHGDISQFAREDPLVRELERIVREKMGARVCVNHGECLPLIRPQTQPRQYLRADSAATARHAYRRLWEGYTRQNSLLSYAMQPHMIRDILSDLEIAWKRAEYEDASACDSQLPLHTSGEMPVVSRAITGTFATVKRGKGRRQVDKEIGALLTSRLAECGLSLFQVSLKTRIPQRTLERLFHLELDDFPPSRLQAYLFEIAKILSLDFDELKHKFGL